MKKKINSLMLLTTAACLLPLLLAVALYPRLPAQIAIHFNSAGDPDNFLPKALAAFGLPVLLAVINLFTHFMLNNDPKKANMTGGLLIISRWGVPVASLVLNPITLFYSIGMRIPIHLIAPTLVGIILIVCGNYMPKSRQSYTLGIRLPWTLHSEENWRRTHHLAGYLYILGGIFTILGGYVFKSSLPYILPILALLILIPALYSFSLYKKGI